jgi:large conductance mechanosensitive channel
MLKVFREFRAFAVGGNMLDLALGFIIGAAFSKLVEAFAQNVIMDFVAALFGQPDFTALNIRIHHSQIHVGVFFSQLVSFLLLAWVLFVLVKMISAFGIGRQRVFEERECPYCLEHVSPRALICKTCSQPLVDELPALAEAEKRAAELRARKGLNLPPIPVPARRREPAATAPAERDQ